MDQNIPRKYTKFIFIPVVNHFELLKKAVSSLKLGLLDEYIIFNNSGSPIDPTEYPGFKIMNNECHKMTFMQTQNYFIDYAINNSYDYFMFMHNDGEDLDGTLERLVMKSEELISAGDNWGVIFTHYDVLCSFNTICSKVVGHWGDDQWPKEQKTGYYLDVDYYRRITLAGFKKINIPNNVAHNVASNTIKDPKEFADWRKISDKVCNHYIKKWGGETNKETFVVPFGGK